MIVGITGSSGAGKTTVCEILEMKYEAYIINADEIVRELEIDNKNYLAEILKIFGKEILLENGYINRRKLASIIYENEQNRLALNNITFKYITAEIEKRVKQISTMIDSVEKRLNLTEKIEPLIVIDAPLLFEAGLENMCDITIAVVSQNKETQINRIMKRDSISREQAISRLNAQQTNEFYKANCNYIIVNDDKIESIEKQIDKFQIIYEEKNKHKVKRNIR